MTPCRHCGCVTEAACLTPAGPCYYIESGLCSAPACVRTELKSLRIEVNLQTALLQTAVADREACGLCGNPLLPGRAQPHVCDRCHRQLATCFPRA